MTEQWENNMKHRASGLKISPKSSSWQQLRGRLDDHKKSRQKSRLIYVISSIAACLFLASIIFMNQEDEATSKYAYQNSSSFIVENVSVKLSDTEYDKALFQWVNGSGQFNYSAKESTSLTF